MKEENKVKTQEKEAKDAMKKEEKEKLKEAKLKLKEEKKKERAEKRAMNEATHRNDSKIIVGIVALVIVVALGIFGVYFYKASFEVVATFDGGKVTKAEYDVYYKTFANILSQYYGYSDSVIPEEIAKKAAVDKIIVKLAKEAGTKITDENQSSIDEIFNNDEYVQSFVSQGMDIDKTKELYYNDYLITQYLEDLKENASDEDVSKQISDFYSYNEKTGVYTFKYWDKRNRFYGEIYDTNGFVIGFSKSKIS